MSYNNTSDTRSSDRASESAPELVSSGLRRLLALGLSLGARSHVSQTTTEQFSEDQPGLSSISTSACVTFTFDDDTPDQIYTGPARDLASADLADVATEAMTAAANNRAPVASVPPSPASSVISIGSTIDSDEYPSTFDTHLDALDTTGLKPYVVDSDTPRIEFAPTPSSSPAPSGPVPESSNSATATAPVATPTTTSGPDSGNRWYVVTTGTKVGVFRGWNNTAQYVVGVPCACYVRVGTEAAGQATFDAALADNKVKLVV